MEETLPTNPHLPSMRSYTLGKDEMNLSEWPLSLPRKAETSPHVLTFEDEYYCSRLRKTIRRTLKIKGHVELGLPKPFDEDVLLALVQLTRTNVDFSTPLVPFSRSQILDVLGLSDSGVQYAKVKRSIELLGGVLICPSRAYFDNRTKTWPENSRFYHILESADLKGWDDRRRPPLGGQLEFPFSVFEWNRQFFKSFQCGFLRSIDMRLYRSLRKPVAKRAYRYFGKDLFGKTQKTYDLETLVKQKLGARQNGDLSEVKKAAKAALMPLFEEGVLALHSWDETFSKRMDGGIDVFVERGPRLDVRKRNKSLTHAETEARETLVRYGLDMETAEEFYEVPPSEVHAQVNFVKYLEANKPGDIRTTPQGMLVDRLRRGLPIPNWFQKELQSAKAQKQRAKENDKVRSLEEARDRRDREQAERLQRYLSGLEPRAREQFEEQALARASKFERDQLQREGSVGKAVRDSLFLRQFEEAVEG